MITRWKFQLGMVLSVLAMQVVGTTKAAERPNVIVVQADDLAWGDLSFHGNQSGSTPNLDALGQASVRFDRFYIGPNAVATQAEFMTGRPVDRVTVRSTNGSNVSLATDERTLARILRASGYRTGFAGQWHLGHQTPAHPLNVGYEVFRGYTLGKPDRFSKSLIEDGFEIQTGSNNAVGDLFTFSTEFVRQHAKETFFLHVNIPAPTNPDQLPESIWNRFRELEIKQSIEGEDKEAIRVSLANVAMVDAGVGKLMRMLDELKISERTIVLFMSNSGPRAMRWNGGMKGLVGELDEGSLRSPLFVRWPQAFKRTKLLMQIGDVKDLLPTLAELTNVPTAGSKALSGISLAKPILGRQSGLGERVIFTQMGPLVTARSQAFRLDAQGNLFDMVADAGQKKPLQDRAVDYRKALEQEVVQFKATLVEPMSIDRPISVGHPDYLMTHLLVSDAVCEGCELEIGERGSRSVVRGLKGEDALQWKLNVAEAGTFQIKLWYACDDSAVGSRLKILPRKANGELMEAAATNVAIEKPVLVRPKPKPATVDEKLNQDSKAETVPEPIKGESSDKASEGGEEAEDVSAEPVEEPVTNPSEPPVRLPTDFFFSVESSPMELSPGEIDLRLQLDRTIGETGVDVWLVQLKRVK